jgi:hypothetical protein
VSFNEEATIIVPKQTKELQRITTLESAEITLQENDISFSESDCTAFD